MSSRASLCDRAAPRSVPLGDTLGVSDLRLAVEEITSFQSHICPLWGMTNTEYCVQTPVDQYKNSVYWLRLPMWVIQIFLKIKLKNHMTYRKYQML
jgi:hypothetical protein